VSDPSSPEELVAYTRDFGGDVPPTVALALADLIVGYQALISEHHAGGALDGVLIGDPCPVCARAAGERL
jgi:hypothetical protein